MDFGSGKAYTATIPVGIGKICKAIILAPKTRFYLPVFVGQDTRSTFEFLDFPVRVHKQTNRPGVTQKRYVPVS
jgi:hypothetical protein